MTLNKYANKLNEKDFTIKHGGAFGFAELELALEFQFCRLENPRIEFYEIRNLSFG